jgi:hypothetical protein
MEIKLNQLNTNIKGNEEKLYMLKNETKFLSKDGAQINEEFETNCT